MKKTTIFCCFTCKRDEALLPLHAAAIRRMLPEAPILYVIPAGEEVKIPTGTCSITSDWARGHNLSGKDAVRGILTTLAHLPAAFAPGTDPEQVVVVKIDADTLLLRSDWMEHTVDAGCASYAAFESWQPMLPSGAMYAMTGALAAKLAAMANSSWPWLDAPERTPEDRAIYLLALLSVHPSELTVFPWEADSHRILGFSPSFYGDPSPIVAPSICALHCAEKPMLAELPDLNRSHQVHRAMRFALHHTRQRGVRRAG